MSLKYCQGPDCHTYYTQDRLKGQKGNKTYQTRRRSNLYYGNGNFCDQRCMYDWFNNFGTQAVDYFGRITQAKHLTEENAWDKRYDWQSDIDNPHRHYYLNTITRERRSITEQQYNDNNYTLNT